MDQSDNSLTSDKLRGEGEAAIRRQLEGWFTNYPDALKNAVCSRSSIIGEQCLLSSEPQVAYFLSPGFPVEVNLKVLTCSRCHRKISPEPPEHVNIFNLDNILLVHAATYAAFSDSMGGRTTNNKVMFSSSFGSLIDTYKQWGVTQAICDKLEPYCALFSKVYIIIPSLPILRSVLILLIRCSCRAGSCGSVSAVQRRCWRRFVILMLAVPLSVMELMNRRLSRTAPTWTLTSLPLARKNRRLSPSLRSLLQCGQSCMASSLV